MAAVELATAYISLVPSLKGASQKISAELGAVDTTSAGSEMGRKMGGGMVSSMKSLVGPAIAIMGSGMFAGFIKDAASASDATDKFKATMSFAGLDTSAITKAKDAAKQYADQTVYDLPTIQNMTAQLASNGVKDYTGLGQAAGNLNAVAGGSAETFKSVAMVMTQTAGAGKLITQNWNQLANAIPGAAGPLMKSLKDAGAYTGNFRDAMAKGQISSDEFNAALMELGNKPVAVEAAKSTKTFEGAIGSLQATINSGLMSALDAMKPAITGAISGLSNGLGAIFKGFGAIITLFETGKFTGGIRKALGLEEDSPIVGAILNIRGGIKAMFAAYKAGDGDVTSSGFAGVMERVGNAARSVTGGVRAMFAAYKAGDGDVTSSGFAGFMERVGNVAREVTRGIHAMFAAYKAGDGDVTSSGFSGYMERIGNAARTVTGGIRAFFAAFKAGDGDITSSGLAGFLEGLGGQARKLFDGIGPAIRQILPQLIALWGALSPVQLIFKSIQPMLPQLLGIFVQLATVIGGTLGTALRTLVPLFIQLQGVFIRVFQQVLAIVLPVVVKLIMMLGQTLAQLIPIIVPIVTHIAQLAMTLVSQLAPILMRLISTVLPMVVTIFGALLQAIGPVIGMIAGLLIPISQALLPVVSVVFSVISNIITAAMQVIMGIIQVVTGIISGNWAQVWSGILNIVSGVFGLIISLISGAIRLVISVIGAGLGVVASVFFSIWTGIVGYLSTAFSSIVNGASGMLNDLVGFFGSIGGRVLGALGDIGSTLFGAGQALIQGFISGIQGMVGAVGDAVGGVLNFAKQFFPHSPAKRGPFSGSGYTTFSGRALAKDFAAGIASQNDVVADAAAGIMTSASLTGHVGISSALSNSVANRAPAPVHVYIGNEQLDARTYRIASGAVSAADSQSTYVRPGRR